VRPQCFWAGATYAPKLLVKDRHGREVNIQQYLQNAFLDMWELVARSVGDLEGVLGFEVGIMMPFNGWFPTEGMQQMMNEPHRGYIQIPSLHAFDYNTDLHLSHVRKSNSLTTHASLNSLRSFRLPILPVGCWPPYPRFNLDPFIPHAYEEDIDHSAQYIQAQSMAA
jgi:hypothetical protein